MWAMFSLFQRKRPAPPKESLVAASVDPTMWLEPAAPGALLASPRRQRLIEHIWQRTSLSRAQFDALYRTPVERYAALVQHFPASENHHHAYHGGMLDHALECVAYALKLRQSYLLPVGAPPEAQAAQAEAWTACAAYAALLHDLGKIAVDLHVEHADGERWHPWHGALARPYRFRYRKDRLYRLHGAATGLLYTQVLGKQVLDWLHGFPELWASLLYVLAGQYEHAGILGELVQQADGASVAQELGGNPEQAQRAPKQTLQRKLLDGLRYLIKERLRLNQPEASDGWLTQDALWLVSKTVCDKLRAHLLSQGVEGIPANNTAVFDVLQDHGIVQPTADGKAVWKATVASDTWTHSFTFLKLAPALIWDSDDRPAAFAGTVRVEGTVTASATGSAASSPSYEPPSAAPTSDEVSATVHASGGDAVSSVLAVFDDGRSALPAVDPLKTADVTTVDARSSSSPALDDSRPTSDSARSLQDSPGVQFMAWLRKSIQTRILKINDAKALVHTVSGTVYLVSPGIFMRYIQEHPELARLARNEKVPDWQWAQKAFERLRLHKKQNDGLNIWTCEVTGPRKTRRLHGYLLADGHALFAEIPFDNPYLRLLPRSTLTESHAA